MIQIQPADGLEVVVDEMHDVETRSSRGYRVIAVVPAERMESHSVTKSRDQGNGYQQSYTEMVYEKVQRPQYLMRLDANSACARLSEQRDEAVRLTREAEKRRDAAESAIAVFQKQFDQAIAERDRSDAGLATKRKEIEVARAQARKLEVDVAKLRTAIGDLRMREILEGK